MREKLLNEDARRICFMDLHLAVSMTNSYNFTEARKMLDDWKEDSCLRVIGYNYRGRVLSSYGQHDAFEGKYEEAAEHFNGALKMFESLSDKKNVVANALRRETTKLPIWFYNANRWKIFGKSFSTSMVQRTE